MAHATTMITVGGAEYLIDTEGVADTVDLSLAWHAGPFSTGDGGQGLYLPVTMVSRDDLVSIGGHETTSRPEDSKWEKVVANTRASGDDVWKEEFATVLLIPADTHFGAQSSIAKSASQHKVVLCNIASGGEIRSGPHVLQIYTGKVYPVRRLFPDINNCFVRSALEEKQEDDSGCDAGKFRWLSTTDHIAVPSRLRYPSSSPERPLSGLRFGVKDVIDISGLETGCGSADYRKLHKPRTETAACIRQLIEAGAVMVGKMRCCQWCDGQDPLERLEEPTPTNPRGDGFQKPSGSSSGSAAGAASYSWLDFTVGTDTGGSIRHPAGVNGVYGIRASRDSVTSSGLWMKQNALDSSLKKTRFRLLYLVNSPDEQQTCGTTPRFFSAGGTGPEATTPAGKQLESFVCSLEDFLDCKREEVCIFELWKQSHPKELPPDLTEATRKIYQDIVYHDLARNTVEPFIQDFKRVHDGRRPYIEPTTQARLEYGRDLPGKEYEESVRALHLFGEWVYTHLLAVRRRRQGEQQTIPLLVYPQSWGVPRYRDEVTSRAPGDSIFWTGFSTYGISYCSGCPDFTLPVGEVDIYSKVTETVKKLPVAISLLGPRGGDRIMLDVIADMEAEGRLPRIQAGASISGST
ncbi:amidase signature domain-containing protein [Microdochium bolleyi]|uniref:Amidase signature domain-containing protein n=1 Tax=Microdochium bolleyi TaxID=196109 RepID=A0A136IVW8_9PEZI|nr:amidase signature domain-containing protein [Microdochium bolleyi]